MPYTPAHAILAAPLWHLSRKRLPLAPLVVGCLAPDLPYFVHLAPIYAPGHTVMGLITHAVPQGLVALGIWYWWLEKPVLALFSLQPSKRQFSVAWILLVLLSLWLGATTHALLDATSHQSGWFVQRFAPLSYGVGPLPLFKWIQYGGGALGLGAIGGWYLKTRSLATDIVRPGRRAMGIGALCLGLSTLGFMGIANWIHPSYDLSSLAVHSASGAMSGFVVGACLYATIVRLQRVH